MTKENEAQMWLDELERRQHLMTEAEKKRSPGHNRGISSEPEDISSDVRRLRAICMALEEKELHTTVYEGELWARNG